MFKLQQKFQNLLKIVMWYCGKADSKLSPKRSLLKKAFQDSWHELGESVNPDHATYNGSLQVTDNRDPSWSTSSRPENTSPFRRHLQHVESLWKTITLVSLARTTEDYKPVKIV
ncbi:hypothetical protein Tco_1106322 [Tanacetum coccineum]